MTSLTGRILAVDLGSKRIGVAVSDVTGVLASPLLVLDRSGSMAADHQRLSQLVKDEEAVLVIVGLPVDLRGKTGTAARDALAEVARLATVVDVPVQTYDERLTSAAAHKQLAARGLDSKQRRQQIDKFAAAILLQNFLDSRANTP